MHELTAQSLIVNFARSTFFCAEYHHEDLDDLDTYTMLAADHGPMQPGVWVSRRCVTVIVGTMTAEGLRGLWWQADDVLRVACMMLAAEA
jgi:hypothetical protein